MIDWFSDLLFWIIFGAILFLLRRQKIFWTVGALALLLLSVSYTHLTLPTICSV